MSRRLDDRHIYSNPVLIGALTVLVAVVAVMLAYNANNGLPFTPRYTLNVRFRDATELSHGGDVRIGGALVGVVNEVSAERDPSGRPIAVVNLKLNKNIEPLPIDSRFTIRLKGAIGLKYLQITPGRSRQGLRNDATVSARRTNAEVDLDQVLSMFTPRTRAGVQATTLGFGTGLAGRGGDLNDAIGAFVPLLRDLEPVTRNLASRQTDLPGFFHGLERFAGALAPVAQTQAALYANLNTTFRSLAGVAVPFLQDWISQTPAALSAVSTQTPVIRPFVTDTAALFHQFTPGAATLPQSAPVLADALAAGVRTLPGTAVLDGRTVSLAQRLERYGQTPSVQEGIDRLTLTVSRLDPPLAFLTPTQTSCNYVTLALRNLSSLLSDNVDTGTTLRTYPLVIDDVPGGEAVPSSRPYTTPTGPNDQHGPLHLDAYPNTDAPGQTPECSAGNEPYSSRVTVIGNPPGNVGTATEHTKRSGG